MYIQVQTIAAEHTVQLNTLMLAINRSFESLQLLLLCRTAGLIQFNRVRQSRRRRLASEGRESNKFS
jgi:hypothetical protein